MTLTDDAQRHKLRDGHRVVYVTGAMLGEADSQSGEEVRWTELTLYRTTRGNYVLQKIGRSDVFHTPECKRQSKGRKYDSLQGAWDYTLATGDAEPDNRTMEERYVPCEDCDPDHDVAPVFAERDIFSIATYNSAKALFDALHRRDARDANAQYLSRVARELLEKASDKDDGVRQVMEAPVTIE